MAAAREAQEAQLRLLSQEIKKRKRELENTRAREKRRRRTEEALASQLLIYMWVAVGQVDDAVRMFRNSSSHPLAGQASEASLRRLMADLFWRADLEHILALMSREDSRLTNIRSEAYGLHAECLTAARVRELNLTCGVAPSSLAVCWMYDEFLEQAPEDISRARSRLGKTWVSNRKWVQRWRTRWGAAFGSILVNDVEDQAVLRAKVPRAPPLSPGTPRVLLPPGWNLAPFGGPQGSLVPRAGAAASDSRCRGLWRESEAPECSSP